MKDKRVNIRVSEDELKDLKNGALMMSKRLGEVVSVSEFIRAAVVEQLIQEDLYTMPLPGMEDWE